MVTSTKSRTPTKAQVQALLTLGRAGGALRLDPDDHAASVTAKLAARRWITDLRDGAVALTWAGWNALPRLFEDSAAEVAGLTASTWSDYTSRGLVPPHDGFAPHPRSGRAARFWWPWTVEAWLAERRERDGRPDTRGRAPGGRQCTYRRPGTSGRVGLCRRPLDARGVCPAGHTS